MVYKTITTILTDTRDMTALDGAVEVARRSGAHLDAVCLGLDRTQPGFYYAGANAMVFQDNLSQAREEAVALEDTVRKRLEGVDVSWSATGLTTQMVALNGLISHRTRFSDLVILPQPYGNDRGHEYEAITEAALFNGQVPVLVLPDGKQMPETIDAVLVGWDESPEALRATRSALPFLREAATVYITVIDPPQHGPERSDPGGALSQMLARHDVRAEVSVLARTMPRIADLLNRQVRDKNAQLVVMGAYGHSRFRESILGGATRDMLESAEVPVLMTH